MNKNAIITKLSDTVAKSTAKLRKHSPELLLIGGIATGIAAAVMACVASTRVNEVLDDAREEVEAVHTKADNTELVSKKDVDKELATVYLRTGVKLAKLYAPAMAVGALSVTSLLASNDIMRKRNVALAAAYTAVDKGFKDYRSRVIERFGEAVDRELKYNIKTRKIEETVIDENGKEKKVKKTVEVVDENLGSSPYAKFYDDGCKSWEKDAETNLFFLRAEQNFANDRLKSRGYLFLNEVYERLGIKTTKAGQSVGWIYDPDNPEHEGDNYVDFGIYDMYRQNGKCRDFVNGYERVILLDFNVDGDISDRFAMYQR